MRRRSVKYENIKNDTTLTSMMCPKNIRKETVMSKNKKKKSVIKRIIEHFIDYRIVGEYYDRVPLRNGQIMFEKKYIKRYFWRKHT